MPFNLQSNLDSPNSLTRVIELEKEAKIPEVKLYTGENANFS